MFYSHRSFYFCAEIGREWIRQEDNVIWRETQLLMKKLNWLWDIKGEKDAKKIWGYFLFVLQSYFIQFYLVHFKLLKIHFWPQRLIFWIFGFVIDMILKKVFLTVFWFIFRFWLCGNWYLNLFMGDSIIL